MSFTDPEVPPPPPSPPPIDKTERTWAMLCHLTTLVAFLGIPLANIVAPLVIWLLKKEQYPLVDDQGKEALNFQISLTLYVIVAVLLTLTVILAPITIPLLIALLVFDIVMTIIATIKANDGVAYRYPLTIRFIS